jgi:carboxyl-terminal processing protease
MENHVKIPPPPQRERGNSRKIHDARFATILVVAALAFFVGIGIGMRGARADVGWTGFGKISQGAGVSSTSTASSFIGRVLGIGSEAPKGVSDDVDFAMFWDVWRDIKENYYVQPIEDKRLFYGALQGLASAAGDPYTMFFSPEESSAFSESMKGEFSGIGAEIGMKNGELRIVAPLPGSPAERAGILPQDLIVKINGEESLTMSVEEAVSKIRGPKGTEVVLTIGRLNADKKDASGKPTYDTKEVTVTRDVITVKSAKLVDKGNGVFLIEIRSFNEDAAETFNALVDEALKKKAKAFVIDVRNDPGGFLDRAVQIAGSWLDGDVVVKQRKQGRIIDELKGEGDGRLRGVPTVVLVNGGSASASEILAGALQDYGAAKIIGTKTFGKGSVQNLMDYEDGSSMKITISEWLTPKERSIDKEGITPDIDVDFTPDDSNADRDPQLDKALEILSPVR